MWRATDMVPGYHGACWVRVTDDAARTDRDVPPALRAFLSRVNTMALNEDSKHRIGCAYFRVIDAGTPENYMAWHRDNLDGAERYHTAIATDGAPVHLAFLADGQDHLVGQPVESTHATARYTQPGNGTVVRFEQDAHGVLPQLVRPNDRTVIFFATLYQTRAEADLYSTNNTRTGSHAMLPTLEGTRYDIFD